MSIEMYGFNVWRRSGKSYLIIASLGISKLLFNQRRPYLYFQVSTMDDETAEIELVRTFSTTDSHLMSFLDDMSSWNRISTRHAKYLRE